MEERRFFKRVGYENRIRCNVIRGDTTCDAITSAVNISGGGIRLHSHDLRNSFQNVALEIFVPGYGRPIPARGKVVWMKPEDAQDDYSAGVCFTNIDSYDRQMILDYVHFG